MNARYKGRSQESAAAKAGLSVRTGRNLEKGKQADLAQTHRPWRTRKDPFESVWEKELLPLLESKPTLQAITLLEHIQSSDPERYPDSMLRTLQRRVKTWHALHGPDKEVMFRQTHVPGRQGLSDFTTLKNVTITITGVAFVHLLYHFRLAFSHWSYVKVTQGGESFCALSSGLQEALRRLGGVPEEHRTDSLSAAFKNLSTQTQDDLTQRYEDLCLNYGMVPTRNNPGQSHENGSVESSHGHIKRRIEQALLLRGSYDFASIESYQAFIEDVVMQHNRRNAKAITEERLSLKPLPQHSSPDYTDLSVVVTGSSTIEVKRVTYTVPSRLCGETLHVHLYDNRLVCFLGHVFVIELKRIYPASHGCRARQVNYKHVIHSLIKKPQAFRHYALRDELLPTNEYRTIWRLIDEQMPPKQACKMMVGLLHLAARENCEEVLAQIVLKRLKTNAPLSLSQLQDLFAKPSPVVPSIEVTQHQLHQYNQCIPNLQEVRYVSC